VGAISFLLFSQGCVAHPRRLGWLLTLGYTPQPPFGGVLRRYFAKIRGLIKPIKNARTKSARASDSRAHCDEPVRSCGNINGINVEPGGRLMWFQTKSHINRPPGSFYLTSPPTAPRGLVAMGSRIRRPGGLSALFRLKAYLLTNQFRFLIIFYGRYSFVR